MKNFIQLFAVCFMAVLAFSSCREQEPGTTTIIKEKEVTVEKPAEDPGILERAADKVDSEVNKEADKVIDKIGDDN